MARSCAGIFVVWLLCDLCVVNVWLLCGCCVVTVRLLCVFCVVLPLLSCLGVLCQRRLLTVILYEPLNSGAVIAPQVDGYGWWRGQALN